ncbi:hypothetical protein DYBT9623_05301 [Dyadobacter sp. CECT 9623]|uniref:Uncharacterized protein n=1 Tax=Dyadobacter linearis TaxID=2823330 RepID=A0ABN7RH90_9BACT|nr:hypothetical protein [Dyadobacter sp. CECT 9623]CAG5074614.1 hypothetical protein DYBT9623_05301 [Dyadobacter sp. CECT 9623]
MLTIEARHLHERELLLQQQLMEKSELLRKQDLALASAPPDKENVLVRASLLLRHAAEITDLVTCYADQWAKLKERHEHELAGGNAMP